MEALNQIGSGTESIGQEQSPLRGPNGEPPMWKPDRKKGEEEEIKYQIFINIKKI